MDPVAINRRSWHYRLISAVLGTRRSIYPDMDICAYRGLVIKAFVLGIFQLLILTALVVSVIWFLYTSVYGIYLWISTGEMNVIAALTLIITMAGLVMYLAHRFKERRERRRHLSVKRTPGPITEMYRSWKGKYCRPVVFEGRD